MKPLVFPIYESIFPGEEVPEIKDVLNKSSSSKMLRGAAFINSKLHKRQDNLEEQEQMFFIWIKAINVSDRNKIFQNYTNFKIDHLRQGANIVLFNSMPLLRLMELIVQNYNDIPDGDVHREEDEIALLKAWLLCNQTFRFEIPEFAEPNAQNLYEAIVVNRAIQYEFGKIKDFSYQILLGAAFLKYFTETAEFDRHVSKFLLVKGVNRYQEYLLQIVDAYLGQFSGKNFGFSYPLDQTAIRGLFDSIAANYDNDNSKSLVEKFANSQDFMLFREKPLVKRKDDSYYSLHYNFFIDKLYQGLIFDFYHLSSISEKYKTIPDFLQFLGSDFAENHIFVDYIQKCFPNKYIKLVPGGLYDEVEYSDYYVRDGKSIFLFEFKNVKVSSAVKQSKDFKTIKSEVNKKLVFNEKGKAKGVTQLFKVIKALIKKPFYFDNFLQSRIKKIEIFPILVYTDDFFEIDGIQKIVSAEFQQLLSSVEIQDITKVKLNDVTLMHLEDLIDVGSQIQASKYKFTDLLRIQLEKRKKMSKVKPTDMFKMLGRYQSFRVSTARSFRTVDTDLRSKLKEAIFFED